MADNNVSTTTLCCKAIKMLEHPDRPANGYGDDPGSPSDHLSPFDFLHKQAGNSAHPFNPRVPFSSKNYHLGIIQVIEFRKNKNIGAKWFGEVVLGGKRSSVFVEIPGEWLERDIGGILHDTRGLAKFGKCPVHKGVGFTAYWYRLDEEIYVGEEEEKSGGEEDEDEDENEDMEDDEEEEDEDEDDDQYEELRKRVSGDRGIPCDRCSRDQISKSRKYCSRRMSPGGPPKCDRCEENGWACTWNTRGLKTKS
ncbi:hypothetical protein V8E51_009869 [Hyaloscypha variabilis]